MKVYLLTCLTPFLVPRQNKGLHEHSVCLNHGLHFLSFVQSSRVHITRAVLEQFLSFAKYLDGLPHGAPLLKQLCDHVLFNAAIWIHTPAKVCLSVCIYVCVCVWFHDLAAKTQRMMV